MTLETFTPKKAHHTLGAERERLHSENDAFVQGPQPEPIGEQVRDLIELVEALLAPL